MKGEVETGGSDTSLQLSIIESHSFAEVEVILRREVKLKGKLTCFNPYRSSKITLREIDIDNLHPTSFYVLNGHLKLMRELREACLIQVDVDILHMTSESAGLAYYLRGISRSEEPSRIIPPVIECSFDDNGKLLVIDGLHRVMLARDLGHQGVAAVLVENIAAPAPVLPLEWKEICRVETVPLDTKKHRFRFNTPDEVTAWLEANHSNPRFLQGFDTFEKLGLMHDYVPER